MPNTARSSIISAAVVAGLGCATAEPVPPTPTTQPTPETPAAPAPPVARRDPHVEKWHGVDRVDDYFWMRKKDAPEVLAYLRAENAYTEGVMAPAKAFEQALYQELVGRIKETDLTVPFRDGAYFYYTRTEQGKQYPIQCRKQAAGTKATPKVADEIAAAEEILLDLNEIGKNEKFIGLGSFEVSDDAGTLAYGLDNTGFRQFTLRFKNLATGAVGTEAIPRVTSVAFARDGKTVFYTVEDPVSKRSYRLYRHVVGEDAAKDPLLYQEKDEMFDIDVSRSRSKDFLFASSESKTTSEVRYLDARTPTASWKVLAPREHDHRYTVDHRAGQFLIRTDSAAPGAKEKSRNFRLVTAPVKAPDRVHWKEIVAHSEAVMIERHSVFRDHMVLWEREGGVPQVKIVDAKSGKAHRVALPEPVYAVFSDANPEFDAGAVRFNYTSPVTPNTVYDYDVKKKTLALLKRQEVLGGYDPANYQAHLERATAADGTAIPIAIVHRRGIAADPSKPPPMLLYGYGSYGISIPDGFNSNAVSLLDRGVVYAVAHPRGGGELGKRWHEAGRMMAKMNTFTDFVSCAEHLIKGGWTGTDRLIIQGGSAGGLLMGAVMNLRPDLFRAVVAQVPFVDVINTMLDESLPLTVAEFEEWGNPKVKQQYDAMLRYSPYDNVAAKNYPATLVKTSYNDSQVMYWEPAKWVAKLRAKKTDRNPLIFKINLEPAGHGGQSGRYNRLREVAFDWAFILRQLGIER